MKFAAVGYLPLVMCLAGLSGCASLGPGLQGKNDDHLKFERYAQKIHRSFEMGKSLAPENPGLVGQQEELVLAQTLQSFYAPLAGAQRLLTFARQHPGHPLLPVYLEKDAQGRFFDFQDDDEFKNGLYFNNYEAALFDPFYRQALLTYVMKNDWTDAEFDELAQALKDAARLTPRYADFYPVDLTPETRKSFEAFAASHPKGALADRFRFLMLAQDRAGAWEKDRSSLDQDLANLRESTQDSLLKLEIQALLDQPATDPGKAFVWSAALPGAGQIANGDLMGGLLMSGLAGAAWWWTLSRLAEGLRSTDAGDRQAAFGDVGWRAPLVALAHGFAALNASSQARLINLTFEWDTLTEPRLKETFKEQ